jgi:hypothetical protein
MNSEPDVPAVTTFSDCRKDSRPGAGGVATPGNLKERGGRTAGVLQGATSRPAASQGRGGGLPQAPGWAVFALRCAMCCASSHTVVHQRMMAYAALTLYTLCHRASSGRLSLAVGGPRCAVSGQGATGSSAPTARSVSLAPPTSSRQAPSQLNTARSSRQNASSSTAAQAQQPRFSQAAAGGLVRSTSIARRSSFQKHGWVPRSYQPQHGYRQESRIGRLLKEFGGKEDWVAITLLHHQISSILQACVLVLPNGLYPYTKQASNQLRFCVRVRVQLRVRVCDSIHCCHHFSLVSPPLVLNRPTSEVGWCAGGSGPIPIRCST